MDNKSINRLTKHPISGQKHRLPRVRLAANRQANSDQQFHPYDQQKTFMPQECQ